MPFWRWRPALFLMSSGLCLPELHHFISRSHPFLHSRFLCCFFADWFSLLVERMELEFVHKYVSFLLLSLRSSFFEFWLILWFAWHDLMTRFPPLPPFLISLDKPNIFAFILLIFIFSFFLWINMGHSLSGGEQEMGSKFALYLLVYLLSPTQFTLFFSPYTVHLYTTHSHIYFIHICIHCTVYITIGLPISRFPLSYIRFSDPRVYL